MYIITAILFAIILLIILFKGEDWVDADWAVGCCVGAMLICLIGFLICASASFGAVVSEHTYLSEYKVCKTKDKIHLYASDGSEFESSLISDYFKFDKTNKCLIIKKYNTWGMEIKQCIDPLP